MANLGITKTLLILLLALRRLRTPLSESELESFKNEGLALETRPDYWEEIEETLMTIVEENEELNQQFQTIKNKLELLEEIPTEFLPTWEELETELTSGDSKPVTFGLEPDDNLDITPTIVAAGIILKSGNPTKLAQNLSFLGRLNRLEISIDFDYLPVPYGVNSTGKIVSKIRYINTGFCSLNSRELIQVEKPLALNIKNYILKVNVGEFWGIGSLKNTFPDESLEPFFEQEEILEMNVLVHSFDVTIDSPQQKLKLPKTGDSEFLYFPIIFNRTERQSIDIDVMFHGHLLQLMIV